MVLRKTNKNKEIYSNYHWYQAYRISHTALKLLSQPRVGKHPTLSQAKNQSTQSTNELLKQALHTAVAPAVRAAVKT